MNCAHQWPRSAINGPCRHRQSIQIAPEEVWQSRTGRPFLSLNCLDRSATSASNRCSPSFTCGACPPKTKPPSFTSGNGQSTTVVMEKERNRTAELIASTGGALTLALLCNKALFPIRVPITLFIKTGGL
ncbi:hypothetical protein DVH24_018716 [Malus domestica]|uniref:DUF1279 domain-containing protein n=1 Tax=Malus domestica TaxID=3750 RepID=A0A498HQD3_MALDO|nr:hypothetical protein DVH24_018716 [Malus domestica]